MLNTSDVLDSVKTFKKEYSKNKQKTGSEQSNITVCFCRFAEKFIYTSYVLKAEKSVVIVYP